MEMNMESDFSAFDGDVFGSSNSYLGISITLMMTSSLSPSGSSDDNWSNRYDQLSHSRPLGCLGPDFGPANDIPLGGDEYVSRITLTRQLWVA